MHEARWWHRLGPPVLIVSLALALAGPATALAGYQGSVYSNITAFDICDGTPNTTPEKMRKAATAAFAGLGFATGSFTRADFTRSRFLERAATDWAVYVHSHGDFYGGKPGFRVDGGKCSQPVVVSSDIGTRRTGSQRTNLVVMSTCHLGENRTANDMPTVYAIEKVKSGYDTWNGPEFYLGYVGSQWDSDAFEFETLFWDSLLAGSSVGVAFDRALANGSFIADFDANWWGSYSYHGIPGLGQTCARCL